VKLTGAQTIAGVKEFSDQITGSISGSSATVQSLTGTNLINTLSDSSTFLKMTAAERTLLGTTHADLHVAHTAALAGKQATITDGSLTIARTNGLQTALDAHPALDTSVLYHSTANGGRVGVGTTSPAQVLHVHKTSGGDLARFESTGNMNIQYMSANKNFQFTHQGDNVFFYQQGVEVAKFTTDGMYASKALFLPAAVPASATSTGIAGEIRFDASYIYICHSTNNWKRVQLSATGW
jgi:hypothetical protein